MQTSTLNDFSRLRASHGDARFTRYIEEGFPSPIFYPDTMVDPRRVEIFADRPKWRPA
ncbi:MAG: hypothetical protein CM15mP21_4730 [Hyphomicrobiales bacterium]|nr:MAG: hypothetical protein CM15mP21_4730 [Hyphomicrobiales bacterium]